MVKAFKKGILDVAYMGLPPGIIGIEQGSPMKCIAGGHVEGTIMVSQQSYKACEEFKQNIKSSFEQFKGGIIGVPSAGSIHDVILRRYIQEFNLEEDITVKNYDQPELIAYDIQHGQITAGVGTPSLAVYASTLFDSKIIIPPRYLWPYNPSYGIFAHNKLIAQHGKVIMTFLKFHKRASQFLRKKPGKAAKRITKNVTYSNKDYISSILKISPRFCISLSEEYVKSTMLFVDWLIKLKYIKRKFERKEIFEFSFVNEVHPQNDHYR
jgi:NitT/TauT family transport system substrate-binding protein